MKRLFFIIAVCTGLSSISQAQYATQALDNLTVPTNINTNLIPKGVNSQFLGTAAKPWKFVFLGSGVYLNNSLFMQTKTLATTFVGANAGFNTTGTYNTGLGYKALYANTTGINNTAVGAEALNANFGSNNTSVGYRSLFTNVEGTNNTAVGSSALRSNTRGTQNVAIGTSALYSNSTGAASIAIGYNSLYSNTEGYTNIGIGKNALYKNTTGAGNIAIGENALYSNLQGGNNIGIGAFTLRDNSIGRDNLAIGLASLANNKDGNQNTAIGNDVLTANTSGHENTAVGYATMLNNTTGFYNTALGSNAVEANTTGSSNTGLGFEALFMNQTGNNNSALGDRAMYLNSNGSDNTSVGNLSMFFNQAGGSNTAHGSQALYNNQNGSYNTAVGVLSLSDNVSGNYNVAVGYSAGLNNKGNYNNTSVGSLAGNSPAEYSTFVGMGSLSPQDKMVKNATAIGFQAYVPGDNQVVIGNSNVTSIGGYANWTNFSDGRYKQNVQENVPGLKFIQALRPVTYTLDVNGIQQSSKVNAAGKSETQTNAKQSDFAARSTEAKAKIVYTGFIGQEVEKAAENLHYDFSGVKKPANDKDFYGLRYSEFVVPLVKAVQELSAKADSLEEQNAQLNALNNKLEERLAALENIVLSKNGAALSDAAGTWLGQNVPNPANSSTVIPFKLPQGTKSANIVLTEMGSGRNVLTVPVTASQQNVSVTVPSASGTYVYSLMINGKAVESKKMVVAK